MDYVVNEMNKLNAKEIISWIYEKPYSIYSMNGSKEKMNEFMNRSYYSVDQNVYQL